MFDGFKEHKKASESVAEWSEGESVVESFLKTTPDSDTLKGLA